MIDHSTTYAYMFYIECLYILYFFVSIDNSLRNVILSHNMIFTIFYCVVVFILTNRFFIVVPFLIDKLKELRMYLSKIIEHASMLTFYIGWLASFIIITLGCEKEKFSLNKRIFSSFILTILAVILSPIMRTVFDFLKF